MFSFRACFVPLNSNSQRKFVKVCKTLGFGICFQRGQNHTGARQQVNVTALTRRGLALAKMQSYCIHDETIIGHMCKNALTRHGAYIKFE